MTANTTSYFPFQSLTRYDKYVFSITTDKDIFSHFGWLCVGTTNL